LNSTARSFFALLLVLLCVPAFAANDCPGIQSLNATDVQTGQTVTITWSYQGSAAPQAQTLSGHDFAEPVILQPGQTSYTYTATKPGEKHVQLSASTACGTVTRAAKYHVKQCNIVEPIVTVDQTSVAPGGAINASIDLLPGYSVRWEVTNATTTSSLNGETIALTATAPGVVTIDAYVSRGNSCTIQITRTVTVSNPSCEIEEPEVYTSPSALPSDYFDVFVPVRPGEVITWAVRGAELIYSDSDQAALLVFTPATGSFEIDIIITSASCSRTFTRTYEVTACNPTATVSAGAAESCGVQIIAVDFTGTAPFRGTWSDGTSFFSRTNHLERRVTTAGTYSITFFADRFCQGVATGSVTAPGAVVPPAPSFTIDPMVDGWYWSTTTCPGTVRTATLDAPIPAGFEVEWTIENGTIVGGQGTPVLQFAGTEPGDLILNAVLRNDAGCVSETYTDPWMVTYGQPEVAITVEPSVIPAGGTAIITMTAKWHVGSDITSSMGDLIAFYDQPAEGVTRWEYRSSHGGGDATINAYVQNLCGQSATASIPLTIDGSSPLQGTATVRPLGNSCLDYLAYAEFTGTAPFTGTWSSGETFTTNEGYAYLRPQNGGTYTLTSFSDANGEGTVSGSATFEFAGLPQPEFTLSEQWICPNGTFTATLTTPLPDGVTAEWHVNNGTILSGQGTGTLQVQATDATVVLTVQLIGPGTCSPQASWQSVGINTYASNPMFDLYGVDAGGEAYISVWLDLNTAEWHVENTLGDTIEVVSENFPFVTLRYVSTHGIGTSDIRIYGSTHCGQTFETTHTMHIMAPAPTANLSYVQGESCGAVITVNFTGTAPFSGTWNDGTTFTTNESSITRFVPNAGWYYLTSFSDAVRTGGSNYLFANVKYLPYVFANTSAYELCPNGTMTATVPDPIPGLEIVWTIEGTAARIVSGQGTANVVIEAVEPGEFLVGTRYRSAEGCEGNNSGSAHRVLEACPVNE